MTDIANWQQVGGFSLWLTPRTPREVAIVKAQIDQDEASFWPTVEAFRAGQLKPIPSRRISFHEAGHAVVALLVGTTLDFVFADALRGAVLTRPAVQFNSDNAILVTMAGSLAEGIPDNWTYRPTDAELEAMRAFEAPSSDINRIFKILSSRQPAVAGRATIDKFRAFEAATIAILARTDVRRAICALADELMRVGFLEGGPATEIASLHIVPGSLKGEI